MRNYFDYKSPTPILFITNVNPKTSLSPLAKQPLLLEQILEMNDNL